MSGAVGGIARIGLTAAGYYFGGPVGGFAASVAGSLLFPGKLPGITGPRIDDAPVTNSAEGVAIPIFYGTIDTTGNVVWDGDFKTIKHKKKQGGKGGPSQSVTSFTYTRSWALMLGRQIQGVQRIWDEGGTKLIYDCRPQQDGESDSAFAQRLAASDELDEQMTIYLGTRDQLPDPTIESYLGVDNTPAYRNCSYLVITDRDVTSTNARIPQWKVEVTAAELVSTPIAELRSDVLYPWELGVNDPRACKNDHLYQVDGEIAWFPAMGAALIDAGLPTDRMVIGWSVDGETINGLTPGSNPAEEVVLYLHLNHADPVAFESVPGGTGTPTCAEMSAVGAEEDAGGLWRSDSIGIYSLHWLTSPPSGSNYTNQVCELTTLVPEDQQSLCRPNVGYGVSDFSADLATCVSTTVALGQAFSGMSGTSTVVTDEGADRRIRRIGLPQDDVGRWDEPRAGKYITSDIRVLCRRVPRAPDTLCAPRCDNEAPDYPPDPDNFCLIGDAPSSKAPYGQAAGPYRWLQLYAELAGNVIRYPLGPVVETGGEGDDQATWQAAYAAALIAGTAEPGLTYDASGLGGVDTYPRNEIYANYRNYILSVFEAEGGYSLGGIVSDITRRSGIPSADDYDTSELTEIVDGYALKRVMNAREAIDHLRPYGFFDVVDAGDKLKFPRRGKASVAELTLADLGARRYGEAETQPVRLMTSEDIEISPVMRVTYIQPHAEYQTGIQVRGRTEVAGEGRADLQLAIAMSDDKAAQIRDVVLHEQYVRRETYETSARPKWMLLEPADPIVIPVAGGTQRVMIDKRRFAPGAPVQFDLSREDATLYYPESTGVPSGIGEQTLEPIGDTTLIVIDTAALLPSDDDAGVYLAARGEGNRWRGYGLFESIDGGANYDRIDAFETSSSMGTIDSALPAGPYHLWDYANELLVTMDEGTLESRTQDAVLTGANLAVVGAAGRWELVLFADVELDSVDDEGRNVYRVSTFLRGRQGTEWAIGLSQAGDAFILADTCERLPLPPAAIGIPRLFKAVSFGKQMETGPVQSFTPAGFALECYAPVLISGSRDGSGNLQILGSRRARISGEWNDSDFVPLNEESERYEVDVLDGVDVVRNITASSFPIAYSAADQVIDFGSAQSAINVVVYQISATVGRGYPTEATV